MKKHVILVVLVLCGIKLFSQEVTMCEAFDMLVKSAPANFQDYKGEKVDDPKNQSKFNTTLKIKGAKNAYIDEFLDYNNFTADFGDFTTEAQANFIILELENDFTECKSGFEFVKMKDIIGTSFNEVFVYKNNTGATVYNAYFKKSKKNEGFNVSFTLYKNDLYKKYVYLTNEQQNETINQEIRKVVDARKTNFDELKGELTNNGYVKFYSTNFCLSDFTNCRIYPAETRNFSSSIDNLSNFAVTLISNATQEDTQKVLKNATVIIAQSLGKGYAFGVSQNGNKIVFCLNEDVGKELKEFIVISATKSYMGRWSCTLEIYAPE
jgi:hypothetical protein